MKPETAEWVGFAAGVAVYLAGVLVLLLFLPGEVLTALEKDMAETTCLGLACNGEYGLLLFLAGLAATFLLVGWLWSLLGPKNRGSTNEE